MITRECKEYQDWKNQVISNFDHKCHWCGSSEDLCAHHEIPFTGETPETDLDADNGICLCRACHTKLHHTGENNPRGFLGKKHSEKTRQKISEAMSGENHPMYGNGDKIRGENNPMYGKHHSEETKDKMRHAAKCRKDIKIINERYKYYLEKVGE